MTLIAHIKVTADDSYLLLDDSFQIDLSILFAAMFSGGINIAGRV